MKIKKLFIGLIVGFVILCFCNTPSIAEEKAHIVIISNSETPQQIEFINNFKSYVSRYKASTTFKLLSLAKDKKNELETIQKINQEKPKLIICLGSSATQLVSQHIKEIPIISSMVLRPLIKEASSNFTTLYLEYSLETQVKWLKLLLPQTRRVGIIFSTDENKHRIDKAKTYFVENGLQVVSHRIKKPNELPDALRSLAVNSDVLLGLNDRLVFSPKTAKNLLLFSFRNQIPLIGLSSSWVKAGALYDLDWDYGEIGKHCGETAIKILGGESVSSIPSAEPQSVALCLNLKSAKRMKIKIPEKIVNKAKAIY